MNRSQPGHYHHGDLRATLMELALHCIAEEGTDKLSLRALARAAEASYAPVLTLMERLLRRRRNWDMTATKLGGIVWSVVHGIASLLIFTIERPSPDHRLTPVRSLEELKADPETALRTLLEGVLRTP